MKWAMEVSGCLPRQPQARAVGTHFGFHFNLTSGCLIMYLWPFIATLQEEEVGVVRGMAGLKTLEKQFDVTENPAAATSGHANGHATPQGAVTAL